MSDKEPPDFLFEAGAFEALKRFPKKFALQRCTVNGEDAVAIVRVQRVNGIVHTAPQFVSITPGMTLLSRDGQAPAVSLHDLELAAKGPLS